VELGESDVEGKLAEWNERIAHYREMRVHPDLPVRKLICFYPMSKRREGDDNWFALSYDERKAMMMGHGTLGRKYAGRVTQLITGSTGLDDWEWGVTLFSDDLAALKEIVRRQNAALQNPLTMMALGAMGLHTLVRDLTPDVSQDGLLRSRVELSYPQVKGMLAYVRSSLEARAQRAAQARAAAAEAASAPPSAVGSGPPSTPASKPERQAPP
jgi:hypothetical protein